MSDIILPETEEQEVALTYKATEEDEERFFLMYHMNMQPTEAEGLKAEYRKWLIARFVAQRKMEQEMMQRHQLMQEIGPSIFKG